MGPERNKMSGQEEQENNAWQLERSLETYDEEYQVERILDKKIGADGTVYYLIKWQGYEDEVIACRSNFMRFDFIKHTLPVAAISSN